MRGWKGEGKGFARERLIRLFASRKRFHFSFVLPKLASWPRPRSWRTRHRTRWFHSHANANAPLEMAKITVRRFHLPPFLPRLSLSALHDRLPFVYLTMPRRFAFQEPEAKDEEKKDWTHAYADDLKTEVYTEVNADPKASVHATEWRKIMSGDPVEINPSVGSGSMSGPRGGSATTGAELSPH